MSNWRLWPTKSKPNGTCLGSTAALFQEAPQGIATRWRQIAHHCWIGNSGGYPKESCVHRLQLQTSHRGKKVKNWNWKECSFGISGKWRSHASTARRTKCTQSCFLVQDCRRFSQYFRVFIIDAIPHEGVHVLGQRSLARVVDVGRHVVWRALVTRIQLYHLTPVELIALIVHVPDTSSGSMVHRPSNCAPIVRMVVGFWTCTSNHVLGLYEECPQSSYLAYVAHLVPVHARTLLVFLPEAIF